MKHNIIKYLRWFTATACMIYVFNLLSVVRDFDTIKPIFPVIILTGFATILSLKAYSEPKVVLSVSIALLIATAFIASLFIINLPVFGYDYYLSWALWTFGIGIPVMAHIFKKYE